MKKRTVFERLFWSPNYFTIAIRKRLSEELPIWERQSFVPDCVMPASRNYWIADPMLAEDNGHTYMFYEAVINGKGRIEVVEINGDGTISKPMVALEREYHLSYPFVFRDDEEWYMIPESCAANKVQLLKATYFPTDWQYVTTLLDEYAVDTTIQEINGRFLMLTFLPQVGSENVVPKAFWIDLSGDIRLNEISWNEFDTLLVRGAGKMIKDMGRYIRPAQINQPLSYGDGILFAQCHCTDMAYAETEIGRLNADNIHIHGLKADGLHTYAATEQFEAIDVRCRLFDPWKALRRLAGK